MGETSLFASGRRDGVNGEVRAAGGGRGPSPGAQALLELLVTPSMGQPLWQQGGELGAEGQGAQTSRVVTMFPKECLFTLCMRVDNVSNACVHM